MKTQEGTEIIISLITNQSKTQSAAKIIFKADSIGDINIDQLRTIAETIVPDLKWEYDDEMQLAAYPGGYHDVYFLAAAYKKEEL